MQVQHFKNFISTLSLAAICGLALLLPLETYAATGDITVEFQTNPLFKVDAWAPGESVSRYIRFTNNTSVSRQVGLRVTSFSDPDLLSGQIDMVIRKGATQLWTGTLRQLYALGEVPVETLGGQQTSRYDIDATFNYVSDDRFQGTSVYFNLDMGLLACSDSSCGSPVVTSSTGGGGNVFTPIPAGGLNFPPSGGSSGSTPANPPQTTNPLEIFEGTITVKTYDSGVAIVSWKTNLPSDGKTVYADQQNKPNITFDPTTTSGRMGYDYAQSEYNGQVYHEVYLYGLEPGSTYVFRVANNTSTQTAHSFEHSFVMPKSGEQFSPQEYQAGKVESIVDPRVRGASDRGYVGDSGASIGVPNANPRGDRVDDVKPGVAPDSTVVPLPVDEKPNTDAQPATSDDGRVFGFTPRGAGIAFGALVWFLLLFYLHQFFIHTNKK